MNCTFGNSKRFHCLSYGSIIFYNVVFRSHFETAAGLTQSITANCSCVMPFATRKEYIFPPIAIL